MNAIKRFTSTLLVMAMVISVCGSTFAMPLNAGVPVFSSMEERNASGDESDTFIIQNPNARFGLITKYVYKQTLTLNDYRLGWHPDFSQEEGYFAAGYWFSATPSISMSVSLNIGDSISVSVGAATPSNGIHIYANKNVRTRPWVRADLTVKVYDVQFYDSISGALVSENKNGFSEVTKVADRQYFAEPV